MNCKHGRFLKVYLQGWIGSGGTGTGNMQGSLFEIYFEGQVSRGGTGTGTGPKR